MYIYARCIQRVKQWWICVAFIIWFGVINFSSILKKHEIFSTSNNLWLYLMCEFRELKHKYGSAALPETCRWCSRLCWALLYQPKRVIVEANFWRQLELRTETDEWNLSRKVADGSSLSISDTAWVSAAFPHSRWSEAPASLQWPVAWHGIQSQECTHVRATRTREQNFAWFNFRRCALVTKIKQCKKLKGEIYSTWKFPDLR